MPSDGLVIKAHRARFVAIDAAAYPVAGGAAGYIETDVSATTGTNQERIWMVHVSAAAGQLTGVRQTGAAVANARYTNFTTIWLASVDGAGHLDLYREAANNDYSIVGYLEIG